MDTLKNLLYPLLLYMSLARSLAADDIFVDFVVVRFQESEIRDCMKGF